MLGVEIDDPILAVWVVAKYLVEMGVLVIWVALELRRRINLSGYFIIERRFKTLAETFAVLSLLYRHSLFALFVVIPFAALFFTCAFATFVSYKLCSNRRSASFLDKVRRILFGYCNN